MEGLLAEHGTSYWLRPVRRREFALTGGGHGVVWTIEREKVLEFQFLQRGPASLVVHDFSLYEPLRRLLRTRHVHIWLAPDGDAPCS